MAMAEGMEEAADLLDLVFHLSFALRLVTGREAHTHTQEFKGGLH